MLRAALGFFVLALIAILFGATGLVGISMEVGRTLLAIFLILSVIAIIASLVSDKAPNVHRKQNKSL